MRQLYYVLYFIMLGSCTIAEYDAALEEGTFDPALRLVKMEFFDQFENRTWIYFYNLKDQLIKIDYGDGIRLLEYNSGKISKSSYYNDDGRLILQDQIFYDENEKIKYVNYYVANFAEVLNLRHSEEFEYDQDGLMSRILTDNNGDGKFDEIARFFWDNNNVEKVEYFRDGEKWIEFYYSYDNKFNYLSDLPNSYNNPVASSSNNVTEYSWIDYSGTFELRCNPCLRDYQYNYLDYPISYLSNNSTLTKLTYE